MISLGRHSYVGTPAPDLEDRACVVSVGNFSSIAGGLRIVAGASEHPPTNFPRCVSSFPLAQKLGADYLPCGPRGSGEVTIGHDVWIGSHATILGGVTIGSGAIVGAGSLVARDVSPYEVVAGNPARAVRWRFNSETIRRLLGTEWWNWPDEKIRLAAPFMKDVDRFLAWCDAGCRQSAD